MRTLFAALSFVFFLTPAQANDDLKKYAEFQALYTEQIIKSIDQVLIEASQMLERNLDEKELILHTSLSRYVERIPGIRALITTDEKGFLWIDSFTYPARDIKLIDREYVKHALNSNTRELYIGHPVIGRSSGVSFIPLARPLLSLNKKPLGALAAILTPDTLIKRDILCKQCSVIIFGADGRKLTSYPPSLIYPENFYKKVIAQKATSIFDSKLGDTVSKSIVISFDTYGLSVVVSQPLLSP